MIHADTMEATMNVLEDTMEAGVARGMTPEDALDTRARAEGICSECLLGVAAMNSETPDQVVSFIVGALMAAAVINNKVDE